MKSAWRTVAGTPVRRWVRIRESAEMRLPHERERAEKAELVSVGFVPERIRKEGYMFKGEKGLTG